MPPKKVLRSWDVWVWDRAVLPLDAHDRRVLIIALENGRLRVTAESYINYQFRWAFQFDVPADTKQVLVDYTEILPRITYTLRNRRFNGKRFPREVLTYTQTIAGFAPILIRY